MPTLAAGTVSSSTGCENVKTPAGVVVGLHTLTKCRCESDVFGRAVSESDMLNANAVSRTRRMSLRIKRDRKSYVRGAHESWRSPADLRDSRLLNLSCGFSRSFRGLAFVFIRRTRHGRSVPRTSPRSMATLGEGRRICTRRLHVTRSSLTMETRGFAARSSIRL
jgi:hypothetical protein